MLSREERLQAIKDRWSNEPLGVTFPSLGVNMSDPKTCAEFLTSDRFVTSDQAANIAHFGVPDPKVLFAVLQSHFDSGTQIQPKIVKEAARVLQVFHQDAVTAAAQYAAGAPKPDPVLHAAHVANAQATEKCQSILTELARVLGISLTGRQR
jgi:hypothetical protein